MSSHGVVHKGKRCNTGGLDTLTPKGQRFETSTAHQAWNWPRFSVTESLELTTATVWDITG
jgi:hypothetical protein